MSRKTYIAMLSGGRDSTAMVELLLSQGKRVDYILFADTLHEFPQMYEYLEKFDNHIQSKYDKHITYLKPRDTFEDWVFGEIKRGELKGKIRGLPLKLFPCFWTREAKVNSVGRWMKKKGISNVIEYIGYTYSEINRSKVKATNQIYPLIDARMCEADVDVLLKSINMVNPLYDYFSRTGCYFCIKQGDRPLYVLYKKFPEQWEYMKKIESKLKSMDNVTNNQWFIKRSLSAYETVFTNGTHKHLSIEAPKSCECSIEITNQLDLFNF